VVDFPDGALFVTDSNIIVDQKAEIDDDLQDELFRRWFVSGEGSAEPAWLERELRRRKNGFKIVSFHHPLLSVAFHASDWAKPSYGRNLTDKRAQLLRLLEAENVDVVFSGHDHLYQHVVVQRSSGAAGGGSGIHFIVSSGGGAPIRDRPGEERETEQIAKYRADGIDCALVKVAETHHYCLVRVSSSELSVQTIAVTGDADTTGRVIDEFKLKK
jgi:hypothetical protein